jgi:hypothetical protein
MKGFFFFIKLAFKTSKLTCDCLDYLLNHPFSQGTTISVRKINHTDVFFAALSVGVTIIIYTSEKTLVIRLVSQKKKID